MWFSEQGWQIQLITQARFPFKIAWDFPQNCLIPSIIDVENLIDIAHLKGPLVSPKIWQPLLWNIIGGHTLNFGKWPWCRGKNSIMYQFVGLVMGIKNCYESSPRWVVFGHWGAPKTHFFGFWPKRGQNIYIIKMVK